MAMVVQAVSAEANAEQHGIEAIDGLGSLSFQALRQALADSGRRLVLAPHRAGLLAHPRARGLAGLSPAFSASYRGRLSLLEVSLAKALRAGGLRCCRTLEALTAETAHLARVFAGLCGDLEPRVRLMLVDGERPPAPPDPGAKTALVYALAPPGAGVPLPAARLAAILGTGGLPDLPPDTAAVVRLDEAGGPSPAAGTPPPGRHLVLCVTSERGPQALDTPRLPGRAVCREPAEVLLVSMPFGTLGQPSLALSLLKGVLAPRKAEILYLTFPFARRIGVPFYDWIADAQPFVGSLLGEWIFAGALAPAMPAAERRYLDEVLLEPTARWLADPGDEPSFVTLVPGGIVDEVLRLRREVDSFLDDCVEEVLARRPRIVGLTSVFQQHVASLALARRLKQRAPEVAVVMGGANCEGVMGLTTARLFDADAVVCGEGEVALPQLVERLLAGEPIADLRGVYTRTSPEVVARTDHPANAPSLRHLDDLPYPELEDYFAQLAEHGFQGIYQPRLLFETSRGCWWGEKQHCTFCGLNGTTMAFRSKSPDRALAELKEVTRRHPGLFVGMADNIMDMRYLKTLLPRIAEEGLQLTLFYEVKSNLKKGEVRQLRTAGVSAIQPGIESLSDEVLRIMRKGVKALQNIQLLKWCKELGVWPYWNMLWGFPGEPPEEYERMAGLLPSLYHLPPPVGMSLIFLERFSPNFFASDELGFADVRPLPAYGHVYPAAPEDLADLAYQFRYRHRDARDISSYTRRLARRIVEWREVYAECELRAVDRGDHLLLCDTRPSAARRLTVLEGLPRSVYLACDAAATVEQLCRSVAAARDAVEEVLRPLVADGFMLRQGDTVLALAVQGALDGTAVGSAKLQTDMGGES
ncbi:MAG: RiPP maturation radical SAM C-methyltransferase [Thermoanaerobaculia bacterium]